MGLSDKQLMMRRTAIGASEIAVLCGQSKWSTPVAIFESKVLDFKLEPTLPMGLGNLLEEPIAGVYRKRTGMRTQLVDTLQHPEKRFAIATPDRAVFSGRPPRVPKGAAGLALHQLAGAEKLCQIKSTSWRQRDEWGTPGTDEVPGYYLVQEIWEMGVSGLRSVDVAVLFDKDRFEIYPVSYDEDMFECLYEIGERFMVDHVLPRVPPEPDETERYSEFLERAFPRQTDEDLVATPQHLGPTIVKYATLKTCEKVLQQGLELYRSRICAAVGAHNGIKGPYGKLTWRKNRDTEKVDHEAAYRECRTILGLLMNVAGPKMPKDEREEMEKRIRSLELRNVTTRKGPRVLRANWEDEFMANIAKQLRVDLGVVRNDIQLVHGDVLKDELEEQHGLKALPEPVAPF